MWKDFILGAYGSGHIRIFGIQTLSLMCEVVAHARWITASDLAPDTGYFLSVSEDSFVKIWQISGEDGRVSHCSANGRVFSYIKLVHKYASGTWTS
jgi:WD40 repeat protein